MSKKTSKTWSKKAVIPWALLALPVLMQPVMAAELGGQTTGADKLEEIVVTALPLDQYLVTTSVVNAEDIKQRGNRNVAEVLSNVAGINVSTNGKKNNAGIDMRGIGGSEVKIYMDGVLINPLAKMTSAAAVDVAGIPSDNIEKIEVIKGPAPVIYGTDAKGGVVLITTKTGKKHAGVTANLAVGSYGAKEVRVGAGSFDDKSQYYINAGYTDTNGWHDVHRDSRYVQAQMKWLLDDKSSLAFHGDYSLTNKDCYNAIDPVTGKVISYKNGFWPGLNDWEYRDWERITLGLNYDHQVNKKLDYSLKLYRVTETQGMWADGRMMDKAINYTKKSGFDKKRWNASYWSSGLLGAELSANYAINDKHLVTVGTVQERLDWKKSNSPTSDPVKFGWDTFKNTRQGYYIQDQYAVNNQLDITMGIRRDSYDVTFDGKSKKDADLNPTINAVYRYDDKNTFRASFGQTYSFPSPEQLFGNMSGNPDLQPEHAKNYEFGWKHKFSPTLQSDVAIFQSNISDKIARSSKAKPWENLTWAKIRGVEFELNKKVTNHWSSFVNYTYLNTAAQDEQGEVSELTYIPKHHVNYGVTYTGDHGWKASLTGHWFSRRNTGDMGGKGDTRFGGAKKVYSTLPSYQVIDLHVSKTISDHQEWYVTVYNVLDKKYEDSLFYPGAGRTFMVGTNLTF